MDRKGPSELQEHMLGTYFGLRWGLVGIGFALPVVLPLLASGPLEGSISAYYHAPPRFQVFTPRDLFVGGLLAAGACLYLYKGFCDRENWALNLAAVFAVCVALLPSAATPSDSGRVSFLHGTSAVLFFLCLAYVSLFRSRDTLRLLPQESQRRYARWYVRSGAAMIVLPLSAVLLSWTLGPESGFPVIFVVEMFGVWAFGLYWAIKTSEMRRTEAERRALDAELQRELVPVTPPQEVGVSILRKLSRESPKVERVVPADAHNVR